MIDWSELTLFIYIVARMSGFILFNPLFGRMNIPAAYRTGFSLVLSVCAASSVMAQQAVAVPVGLLDMAIRILLELFLGLVLGMVMNFFFYIPSLAGTLIDMQMGMTMNQIYDPSSQSNLSVTGVLINAMMTMLFFTANGHHTLIRIAVTSGEAVAFGAASFGQNIAGAMLELFVECTLLAVKFALPILGAELMGQVGMGILMKVIPQINVFVINIELKVIIGLVMLLALIQPFSEYLLKAEMQMLREIKSLLDLMGT